jgi:probable phosphoglycerate mutase
MGQRFDTELNEDGIKQANDLADKLIGENFDVIFSSPLKRALKTAQIVAEKINIPIVERGEITERDYGTLSGKTWDEANAASIDGANIKEKDFAQVYDYRPYGGESVEDVKKRVLKFVNELRGNYSDKKVLVVAHGGILKLMHMLFKEEVLDHTPHNASLHEFEI